MVAVMSDTVQSSTSGFVRLALHPGQRPSCQARMWGLPLLTLMPPLSSSLPGVPPQWSQWRSTFGTCLTLALTRAMPTPSP